jgi:hypothetical protein
MENKFNDDFLEMNTDQINQAKKNSAFKGFTPKREFLIDLENFDLNQYEAEGICPGFLNEFNKCRNELQMKESFSKREICETTKKNLLECLSKSGKFINNN